MANSRLTFTPEAATHPSSNFPQYLKIAASERMVLAFDAATKESCYWVAVIPQGWTGTKTAYIYFFMVSATSGDVDVDVEVEAISDIDAFNMLTGSSFDTANVTDGTTVPLTNGYPAVIAVTLTNDDSAVAGDYVRFRLSRDAPNDSASGDMYVTVMEIRDDV